MAVQIFLHGYSIKGKLKKNFIAATLKSFLESIVQ